MVDVEVMIPPGSNPGTFEPTVVQVKAISRASVYVKVGHPNFAFESAWLERLIAENPQIRVVDASSGLARREGDPHVWVSPGCVRKMATNIAASLSELLPQRHEKLQSNLRRLLGEIEELDIELRRTLEPFRGSRFYVFHPAWGYFADEYGLEQVAVEQGSKEPTPSELAGLIRRARSDGVRVVFVQPQFSRESAAVVAEEIGGVVVPLDPLAKDWLANLREVSRRLREAFE
jgi:zinc transport system substrate-binding protein